MQYQAAASYEHNNEALYSTVVQNTLTRCTSINCKPFVASSCYELPHLSLRYQIWVLL